ncbi:MAG: sigma-70 family RNA polymerase sigma factor [Chloroflexi bacterium]|nr:sigma-70 family RNA polymerase sigma factor [Chloroflexota bacterium]
MDEQQLIERSRGGDLDAFNRIVELYQTQVYNLAYRMLGSQAAAEDASQEAFISAYKHIRSYRGGSFKGWLFRIVTNACYDQLRSKKRAAETSLQERLDDDPSWQPASPGESPEEAALTSELSREISKAVSSLPEDQRLVLVMANIQGFSYEEVAEATSSSLGTVKSRLSRARAKVRDYFSSRPELLPAKFRLEV